MLKSMILIVFSVMLSAFAQLLLKQGMTKVGEISSLSKAPSMLLTAISNPLVLAGLAVFGISAVFWLVVLSRVPLSIAYPMVSLGYLFTVLFSWLKFNEPVKLITLMGCLVIMLGVFLISRGMQ